MLFAGWLVTASSALFGSPFWFDLLQRMVQLRGTGKKPDEGGSRKKPVGTVLLAWGEKGGDIRAHTMHFQGDRDAVRRQTVIAALEGVLARLTGKS